MVYMYKHAYLNTVLLLHSTLMLSEDAAKRGGWNSHGNKIVDHGKSWKNHGIVFLRFCGNPVEGIKFILFL